MTYSPKARIRTVLLTAIAFVAGFASGQINLVRRLYDDMEQSGAVVDRRAGTILLQGGNELRVRWNW